jgi:hypothetical protein
MKDSFTVINWTKGLGISFGDKVLNMMRVGSWIKSLIVSASGGLECVSSTKGYAVPFFKDLSENMKIY